MNLAHAAPTAFPTLTPMVQPSWPSTLAFLAVVAWVVLGLVVGVRVSGRRRGDAPKRVAQHTAAAGVGVGVYLAVTAGAAASGLLIADTRPPVVMFFFATTNLVAVGLAVSPAGRRLAGHLRVPALVGFQAFRLPLELILHRWFVEGVVPVQMTYEGLNFDIVTGLAAVVIALWAARARVPTAVLWGFHALGLVLLIRVASVAVLASPVPFRRYFEGPALQLAFHVPYVWIVPICVGGALAGHLIAIRKLVGARAKGAG